MFTASQKQRLSLHGRKCKLSKEQKDQTYQWILQRVTDGISTSGKNIISFISSLTNFYNKLNLTYSEGLKFND